MALDSDSIVDLLATTQKELGKLHWEEVATDLQEHIALPKILRKEKVKFDSGTSIKRNLMTDHSNAAEHVGLFGVDNVNVADVMTSIEVPWRHTTTNYAFERREIAMNRSPAKIVDLVKIRRADSMISLAEKIERTFWSEGPASSSDKITPWGLFHYLTGDTTHTGSAALASTGQFYTGLPTGFANIAGIIPAASNRWWNWSQEHDITTAGNEARSIQNMRRAAYKTSFKSPVEVPSYARGGARRVIYTNFVVLEAFEAYAESQNDRLGPDVASMANKAKFMGHDIIPVPQLDQTNSDYTQPYTNPIVFIDWACFYPAFLSGEYMNESKPKEAPNQHTVFKSHVDLTHNLVCDNRRRLALLID